MVDAAQAGSVNRGGRHGRHDGRMHLQDAVTPPLGIGLGVAPRPESRTEVLVEDDLAALLDEDGAALLDEDGMPILED